MTTPLQVCDRPRRVAALVEVAATDGWSDRGGFDLPARPWDLTDRRWVLSGVVADEAAAARVALGAARGAGVVIACADPALRRLLVEDLGRLGTVEVEELGPDPIDALDDEQRALLEHLAAGEPIAKAAAALYLSPRTAERRVAGIREALGVRTTAEAITLAVASTGGPS